VGRRQAGRQSWRTRTAQRSPWRGWGCRSVGVGLQAKYSRRNGGENHCGGGRRGAEPGGGDGGGGGWVKTGREQGKGTFAFLELNDGSCAANLQVLYCTVMSSHCLLFFIFLCCPWPESARLRALCVCASPESASHRARECLPYTPLSVCGKRVLTTHPPFPLSPLSSSPPHPHPPLCRWW